MVRDVTSLGKICIRAARAPLHAGRYAPTPVLDGVYWGLFQSQERAEAAYRRELSRPARGRTGNLEGGSRPTTTPRRRHRGTTVRVGETCGALQEGSPVTRPNTSDPKGGAEGHPGTRGARSGSTWETHRLHCWDLLHRQLRRAGEQVLHRTRSRTTSSCWDTPRGPRARLPLLRPTTTSTPCSRPRARRLRGDRTATSSATRERDQRARDRSGNRYRMEGVFVRQVSPQWLHHRLVDETRRHRGALRRSREEVLGAGGTTDPGAGPFPLPRARADEGRDCRHRESTHGGDARRPGPARTKNEDWLPAHEKHKRPFRGARTPIVIRAVSAAVALLAVSHARGGSPRTGPAGAASPGLQASPLAGAGWNPPPCSSGPSAQRAAWRPAPPALQQARSTSPQGRPAGGGMNVPHANTPDAARLAGGSQHRRRPRSR
jgi:hypothetical protein